MTSFDTLEMSAESSRPVELYTIALGSITYHYTSNAADMTVDSIVYEATTIERSAFGQGVSDRDRVVTIQVPSNNAFAAHYIGTPPGDRASVSNFRLQRDESPTFATKVLQYKGLVNDVKFDQDGNRASILTRSVEATSSITMPRYTFAGLCQHVLYDASCGANPTTFQVIGNCTAVTGNVITVTGANAKPTNYFRGGFCRLNSGGDYRYIVAHSGNDVTLLQPFNVSVVNSDIQLFAGCNHEYAGHCRDRFARQASFGGWPWVPTKNPFVTGLR